MLMGDLVAVANLVLTFVRSSKFQKKYKSEKQLNMVQKVSKLKHTEIVVDMVVRINSSHRIAYF